MSVSRVPALIVSLVPNMFFSGDIRSDVVVYLAVNSCQCMYNKKERNRNVPGARDASASRALALMSPFVPVVSFSSEVRGLCSCK